MRAFELCHASPFNLPRGQINLELFLYDHIVIGWAREQTEYSAVLFIRLQTRGIIHISP